MYYDKKFEEMNDDWHEEIVYKSLSMDAPTARAQKFLSGIYKELPDFEEVMEASYKYTDPEDEEAVEVAGDLMEEVYNCYDHQAEFFSKLSEKNLNNCARWFNREQVEEYISRNYAPAANDREKEIDGMLQTIWKLEPKTLDYFYSFPGEWEKNGLAGKIREKFGVPERE